MILFKVDMKTFFCCVQLRSTWQLFDPGQVCWITWERLMTGQIRCQIQNLSKVTRLASSNAALVGMAYHVQHSVRGGGKHTRLCQPGSSVFCVKEGWKQSRENMGENRGALPDGAPCSSLASQLLSRTHLIPPPPLCHTPTKVWHVIC